MKQLWRRTFEIWRRYPTLAIPVLAADLLGYGIRWLSPVVRSEVMAWIYAKVTEEHSVLGGTMHTNSYTGIAVTTSYVAGALITTLFSLAEIALYVVAAIVISRMVRNLLAAEEVEVYRETMPPSSYIGGILWLSFFSLLLAWAVVAPLGALRLYWMQFSATTSFLRMPILNCFLILPMYLAIALVLTPMCLRLMARPVPVVFRKEVLSTARWSGVWAGFAVAFISALSFLKFSSIATAGQRLILGVIVSLVTSLPYIPLFISLSLLALDGSEQVPREEVDGSEVGIS